MDGNSKYATRCSTGGRCHEELVLALPMSDRSAARREEARIKGLDRASKLAFIADNDQRDLS